MHTGPEPFFLVFGTGRIVTFWLFALSFVFIVIPVQMNSKE